MLQRIICTENRNWEDKACIKRQEEIKQYQKFQQFSKKLLQFPNTQVIILLVLRGVAQLG